MSDLRDLYQEMILAHSRSPRNYREMDPVDRRVEGHNPLCGDKLVVKLVLEGDKIVDIGFKGSGCAISQAAASTMTEAVKGKDIETINKMFENYHAVVTGDPAGDEEILGKLAVFAGVAEFPMRVKCATLAWHTMQQALQGKDEVATTE